MIKPVLVSIFSRVSAAVLNFGTMILLSRYLGAEGKGISSKLIVLIAGIQVIADFMGGAALVYLASRHKLIRLLIPAWGWTILCSVVAGIVFIHQTEGALFGWHLAFLAFFCSTLNQHIHLLNGRANFLKANLLTVVQAVLIFSASWWFLEASPEINSYIYALYIGWGLPWLISMLMLANLAPTPIEEQPFVSGIRQLFRFGSANQTGHLIQYFTQRIAFFMLPAFALGVYSNAVTISESLWMFASAVAVVQYGSISNSTDKEYSANLSLGLMKLVFVLTVIGGLALCTLPASFFTSLFGQQFEGVVTVLPLLYPGICMMSAYLIIGHYFSGTGQFRNNNYALLAGLITSIAGYAFGYILFADFTMQMVAVITTLANGAIFFSVLWLFSKDTGYQLKDMVPGKKDMMLFRNLIAGRRGNI